MKTPAAVRLSLLKLAVIALVAVLGMRVSVAIAVGPGGVKDIKTFVECLNRIKRANPGSGTIADAVHCVPHGCNFTVTMSRLSAQRACELGGCQLPRVIFNCPGPAEGKRFRPSFLLCPTGSSDVTGQLGMNRIEVGEDVDEMGDMKSADVAVPPGTDFTEFTEGEVLSKVGSSKGCTGCHGSALPGQDRDDNLLSRPIDPFGFFIGGLIDLAPCVIDTNEPGKTVNPEASIACAGPICDQAGKCTPVKMSLDDVCECIDKNMDEIAQTAPTPETLGGQILLELCVKLRNRTRVMDDAVDEDKGDRGVGGGRLSPSR